jgi:hypothetical protein
MGIAVLIIGNSGAGKSASLRNFAKDEIGIINANGKPLPFKGELQTVVYNTDDYGKVLGALQNAKTKTIAIDDSQYLLVNEFMRRASESGYGKFMEMGKNFWNLIKAVSDLPNDKIVYFLHHTDIDDSGRVKAKTIGKLLDEKITVEGMFSIVLLCQCVDGRYIFRTQTNGNDTVKSPMGLFNTVEIENDLKAVDTAIREYYGIKKLKNKEEKKEAK